MHEKMFDPYSEESYLTTSDLPIAHVMKEKKFRTKLTLLQWLENRIVRLSLFLDIPKVN